MAKRFHFGLCRSMHKQLRCSLQLQAKWKVERPPFLFRIDTFGDTGRLGIRHIDYRHHLWLVRNFLSRDSLRDTQELAQTAVPTTLAVLGWECGIELTD